MDIGLWSLGGLAIGSAAAIIGIDHTLAVSAGICIVAAIWIAVSVKPKSPKITSSNLAQDVVRA